MQKILIIGANGFLGKNLINIYHSNENLQRKYALIAGDIQNTNIPPEIPYYKIDITEQEQVNTKLSSIKPNIIILTAAMTDVDQCEINQELATKINFKGPKNVVEACKKTKTKLIFMSTDFIFDGLKDDLYTEKDIPKPQSHYARTKFYAELAIIYSEIEYLICRTSVLYGWNPDKLNFITWILEKLEQGKNLSIVTNQINSPTFVVNLANILFKLTEKQAKGIYHTAGAKALNRYEMAIKCAEIFNHDKDLISPIDNIKQKAPRPEKAGLDVSKLKTILHNEIKVFSLEDGLNYMKNHPIDSK
jgi:dTDP-4-dehydrorhamnose reductase